MPDKIRYNLDLLNLLSKRDNSIIIGNYENLKSDTPISFVCNCGQEYSKKFVQIFRSSGFFCEVCTKQNRKEKVKNTCLKKYGKEHAFQVSKFREEGKKTIKEKYGVNNVSQSQQIKDLKEKTTFAHYGVLNPFQSDSLKKKIKETNRQKYGVAHVLQNKDVMAKVKNSNIVKYGVDHHSKSTEIKEKKRNTCFKNFGVDCHLKSNLIKSQIKQTNLIKYGVEYTLQGKTVRAAGKKTLLDKYGVDHPMKSKQIQEKIKQTNLEKYGTEFASQSEIVKDRMKKTNLRKYGVEYASQCSEIMEKTQKNAKKYKEYTFPSGNKRNVQGYEPFALDQLLKDGYVEEQIFTGRKDVPRITYEIDGKKRYYFPDIYIPEKNKIIEVKSTWTYKCKTDNIQQKKKACIDAGFDYEIWCFDAKGVRINIDEKVEVPVNEVVYH